MKIRKANINDSQEVAEVLVSFYNMDDKEEAKQTFVDERTKGHHYLVAVVDDRIIGLVTWLSHGLPKHGLAELDRICLLPESRGKGVGKELVEALKKDAEEWYNKKGHELRKLYLLTHEDNTDAHKFYENVGFKHETTLKQHYYKDKDEYVYSMIL